MSNFTIDADKLAKALEHFIEAELNHPTVAVVQNRTERRSTVQFDMPYPADLGPMALICKEVLYRVIASPIVNAADAANPKDQIWVTLALAYTHHDGGANGSNIATIWFDDQYQVADVRRVGQ